MNAHFVNPGMQDQGTGGQGTSIAVRQFLKIARGVVPVHRPANLFRVVSMRPVVSYCLRCFGVHWHDVIEGCDDQGEPVKVKICRSCENGEDE